MKQDTVMQTGDKTKYKHVLYAVWRKAERAFSVDNADWKHGFKNTRHDRSIALAIAGPEDLSQSTY